MNFQVLQNPINTIVIRRSNHRGRFTGDVDVDDVAWFVCSDAIITTFANDAPCFFWKKDTIKKKAVF